MGRSRNSQTDEGVVTIEFVLIAPFLLALVLIIAQFGFFWFKTVDANGVARDAARTLALRAGTPDYKDFTPVVTGACPDGNTTDKITVAVTKNYTFSIPLLPPLGGNDTKTITGEGTFRCGG